MFSGREDCQPRSGSGVDGEMRGRLDRGPNGAWQRLCARILQPLCLVCGQRAPWPGLCAGCQADLPRVSARCQQCARPLPAPATCGACLRRPPPWTSARVAWSYAWPVDRLVQALKFQRRPQVAVALADGLARVRPAGPAWRPDALIPVPLHRWRLARRGYNQAHEIARVLGRLLDLRVCASALRRSRHTAAQSGLGARQRRRNLAGAFRVGRARVPAHVALVDDVMTTGTTLAECARTLRRAGVARVDVWVAARADR